jgi:hypothetical protein
VESVANTGTQCGFGSAVIQRAPEVRPPRPDEALATIAHRGRRTLSLEFLTLAVFAIVAIAWAGVTQVYPLVRNWPLLLTNSTTHAVVERIIRAESNGNAGLRNSRSSAAGSGQFLEQTWLEVIRTHRRDLLHGRSDKEVLELRGDPALVREMVARTVERNAAMLKKRGLPVTAGTLYLAYFAGSAGAVAVLTVSDDSDAASVLAKADASGRITREILVKANPFLATFTVGELKVWADRKMRG